MTAAATYNPAEVERIEREAREEIQRRRTATRCDSCGGLIMHRSEHLLAAMADQLEAARARIAALEAGLREACDHLSMMRSLDQRVTERLRALAGGASESITAPASTSPG